MVAAGSGPLLVPVLASLGFLVVALSRDLEERRLQEDPGYEHEDHAEHDDADQRPPFWPRSLRLQGLLEHPAEESGREERQHAEDEEVPDAADDPAAVVHDRGE